MAQGANAPRTQRTGAPAPRFGDRLRYWFDNSMSRGTPALIAWLTVATVLLILAFALILTVFRLGPDGDEQDFFHRLFSNLLHALDPGTIGGDVGPWRFLLTMLVLTLAGLFIVSALIGVIAAGIDTKLADLRRGRSIVLEKEHTVILGWSDSVFTIISELTLANESRRRPVVVVLADRDKVEMEEEIKAKVADLRGTRVVCRSGSPMDVDDLALSSHTSARSVILLAPDSDDPDSEVIKTLLALTHSSPDGGPRIVAEIRNPSNLEAARLVGADRTVLLDIRETVAKLVVQTSRQSGAAAVYTELFDFEGDEIYFLEEHGLRGSTYGAAQLAFEGATVIGLIDRGVSKLNPPPSTPLDGHTLIVIAEDDSALAGQTASLAEPDLDALGEETSTDEGPTNALLLGWNERAPIIVQELDHYAAPGSTLTVVTAYGAPDLPPMANLAVTVVPASTTQRSVLDEHVVTGLDQVIVLCYSDYLDTQAADARTLVTLLHVRDILGRLASTTPVVTEMLDDRNRVLAEVAHVDDVVVSGEFVSLLVTQLSEDQRLEAVFGELLSATGAEIYLRPAEWYVQPGHEVSFATVVAGASRRGETAVGYRKVSQSGDAGATFGVRVNPPKSERLVAEPGDRVVVLAEA